MTIDEKLKLFFEYRYLVENVLYKYSPDKYDIEDLYDAGIVGLFHAIDSYKNINNIDFKTFAFYHIKSEINKKIKIED